MNRKGFTIVELVIVIAVIAILAGVLIPTFSNIVTKAQDSKALQEAKNIHTAYIGEFDYKSGATPAEDYLIEVTAGENGQYVIVRDNKFEPTVYATLAAAEDTFDIDADGDANDKTATATKVPGTKLYTITVE